MTSWKHPEILTGGKLNADSTIAAIMENTDAKAIVDKYLPGFAENEQAKAAYGMTFKALAPMLRTAGGCCYKYAGRIGAIVNSSLSP